MIPPVRPRAQAWHWVRKTVYDGLNEYVVLTDGSRVVFATYEERFRWCADLNAGGRRRERALRRAQA